MLTARVLTAAVLIAALLGALYLGHAVFAIAVAAIVAVGGHEWARLCALGGVRAAAYAAACAALYVLLGHPGAPALLPVLGLAAAFWIVAVPLWLKAGVRASQRPALLGTGFVVLVPAGLAMAALGPRLLLLALGLVWVADSAAYFAGRAFGKRKLAPSISPGKTWEGVAGAAVGCLIYAIICAMLDADLARRVQGPAWTLFLAGVSILFAVSIFGDLFESAVKRQAGAKDSGRLLPGHGGVLDRIDSATAVLPLALLMTQVSP